MYSSAAMKLLASLLLVPAILGCRTSFPAGEGVLIARLDQRDAGQRDRMRTAFRANNPGYDLAFATDVARLDAADTPRFVFVQDGQGMVAVTHPDRAAAFSEAGVGDLVILRPGEALESQELLDLVVFSSPTELPEYLPSTIRPDWDPEITDTPGGCATETGAYRRILLTWQSENGPYVYHALNAHRVRITDSFTHYHPHVGGFDEFYLVQMAQPGARLLTSQAVDAIESPETVTLTEVTTLFEEHELEVGDLVYLPRGTIHRGLGGVLAQVISVPGFVPGAEIAVDEQLAEINERLGLREAGALPVHGVVPVRRIEAVVR
jgi:hypothetical protein